jgi:hypothetical protein
LKLREDLHPGIYEFRFAAIKNEISKASISVSNGKYMQLPRLLYSITWETISDKKELMFITPIPAITLLHFGNSKFLKLSERNLDALVNTYPLVHTVWIDA